MADKMKFKKIWMIYLFFIIYLAFLPNTIQNYKFLPNTRSFLIDKDEEYGSYNNSLRTAESWQLSPIIIDASASGVGANNWTWAVSQEWCNGSGNLDDPYILENITINGQNSSICIEIRNSNTYFIIRNCTSFNSNLGSIQNNAGIKLVNTQNGWLYNNNCSNNVANGILLDECSNNNITENILTNNELTGLTIKNSFNNNINENEVNLNNNIGIWLTNAYNNNISRNIISYNNRGLDLADCTNNKISNNKIFNNTGVGISLTRSINTNISKNTLYNNNRTGISLSSSCNNVIFWNTVHNNGFHFYGGTGIRLSWNSSYNEILWNTVYDNTEDGISLLSACSNNTVMGNLIRNNDGIGVLIYSDSSGNIIYQNEVLENGFRNAINYGNYNLWDNGTVGNIWSSYGGIDANDDGIGDTPYIISQSPLSQDNLPVFWDPPVISLDFPNIDDVFGLNAPNFAVYVAEGVIDEIWYTLDFGITNISCNLNGQLNQSLWNNYDNGQITIIFYVNDSRGFEATAGTIVQKDTTGINPFIFWLVIGIISVVTGITGALIFYKKRKHKILKKLIEKSPEREEQIIRDMSKVRKTILDMSTRFTRIEIREINVVSGIDNDKLIINMVKEMINNKEVHAQYFTNSNSLVFNQQANIDEIDRLMELYSEWEEKRIGEKKPNKQKLI